MNMMQRQRIERAFARAQDYDTHAHVQRRAALDLAARIAALPLPPAPRILEIGCGTGHLTEALEAIPALTTDGSERIITDISADMVARCQRKLGEQPGRRFATLDGEFGDASGYGAFDLICSSLAMQWFDDQGAALRRMLGWLAPGGHCLFATLGARSFAEWRAAHEAEGLRAGTIAFLSADELRAILPSHQAEPHRVDVQIEQHRSGLDFVRSLKAIGANTAWRQHRPLSPAQLRRVAHNFEAAGAAVTYEIVSCHYVRDADATP